MSELVVRLGASGARLQAHVGGPAEAPVRGRFGPRVTVAVSDASLAHAIASAVATALDATIAELPPPPRVVRLRTRRRADALQPAALADAIAVVAVTARNARHLLAIVANLRAKGSEGVQLVWDGADRARVERHVFRVLEHVRATPAEPPVVVAREGEPALALRILIAGRRGTTGC